MYIKALLIFSPFLTALVVGFLTSQAYGGDAGIDEAAGVVSLLALIVGAPVIGVAGAINDRNIRDRQNKEVLSMQGYLFPAIVICGLLALINLVPAAIHFFTQ
jgi:hypothetical protein